jgi:hypothetical protein
MYAGIGSSLVFVRVWCATPIELKLESTKVRRLETMVFLTLIFKLLLDCSSKALRDCSSQNINTHLKSWSSRTSFVYTS